MSTGIVRVILRGAAALALLGALGASALQAGRADEGASEAALERTLEASPEDMATFAPNWVEQIQAAVRSLEKLDADSRRDASGEGLPCVTGPLSSARTLAEVSQAALKTLEEAIGRGEVERAGFEYRKIAIALKKAREAQAAGEECVLGAGIRQGRTRSELTGAPSNPDDDTRGLPNDIVEYGFDPVDASPF